MTYQKVVKKSQKVSSLLNVDRNFASKLPDVMGTYTCYHTQFSVA